MEARRHPRGAVGLADLASRHAVTCSSLRLKVEPLPLANEPQASSFAKLNGLEIPSDAQMNSFPPVVVTL